MSRSKFVTLHINSSNDDGIVELFYVECIVALKQLTWWRMKQLEQPDSAASPEA